uniref:Uncharacterized protein n=1 Tax=Arundo donax TaxID=35708 RepID=A0A0A9B142_ARUDO
MRSTHISCSTSYCRFLLQHNCRFLLTCKLHIDPVPSFLPHVRETH